MYSVGFDVDRLEATSSCIGVDVFGCRKSHIARNASRADCGTIDQMTLDLSPNFGSEVWEEKLIGILSPSKDSFSTY